MLAGLGERRALIRLTRPAKSGFQAPMINAFTALWQDAAARLQPQRTLLIGPGAGGLAAALLSATGAWDGLVDLAWPVPADGQPPRDGHRFTLHCARPQDAAGLLPVPQLVIIEPGSARDSGPTVAAVLYALSTQARRTAKPYPVIILFGVLAADDAADKPPGAEPRPPALAALEDFAAAEAPALIYSVMPLLGGAAILAGRADAERDAVRAVLSGLSMGKVARLAAEAAEAARLALLAETAALREQCDTADIRVERLYAALRRAQLPPAPAAEAPEGPPENGTRGRLARAPRRAVGKLLAVAGWRDAGIANTELEGDAAIARLRRSPVLSEAWYHARYPDVAESGMDPAEHYYRHGAAEGRDPGPDFVTNFYLASEQDVARSGVNPLLHFLDYGGREGRNPSPDFDSAFYLTANRDVAEAGLNPLEHFVAQGRAEGRRGLPPR